jgi:hypothetical protein
MIEKQIINFGGNSTGRVLLLFIHKEASVVYRGERNVSLSYSSEA